ncbi:MAG: hypothetical protein HFH79_17245 [Lachnospiraceae bacterium]|nr:hypothetical protein [Lachnospiraceae bacterium]
MWHRCASHLLIDGQAETEVDAITSAASSGQNFEKLAAAVPKQAEAGDAATVEVA